MTASAANSGREKWQAAMMMTMQMTVASALGSSAALELQMDDGQQRLELQQVLAARAVWAAAAVLVLIQRDEAQLCCLGVAAS